MTALTNQSSNRKSDSDIRSHVSDAAHHRLRLVSYPQLRRIVCEFHEGVLTLRGVVNSYFLKQMAHHTIRDLIGVEVVANRLEVRYPQLE